MRTIPDITDARISDLLLRITPLVKVGDDLYRFEPVDPRTTAFTWGPKVVGAPVQVRPRGWITTYHSWGHPSLFKPSLAEVLAQINDHWLGVDHHGLRFDAFWLDVGSVDSRLWNADGDTPDGYPRASVQLVRILDIPTPAR